MRIQFNIVGNNLDRVLKRFTQSRKQEGKNINRDTDMQGNTLPVIQYWDTRTRKIELFKTIYRKWL